MNQPLPFLVHGQARLYIMIVLAHVLLGIRPVYQPLSCSFFQGHHVLDQNLQNSDIKDRYFCATGMNHSSLSWNLYMDHWSSTVLATTSARVPPKTYQNFERIFLRKETHEKNVFATRLLVCGRSTMKDLVFISGALISASLLLPILKFSPIASIRRTRALPRSGILSHLFISSFWLVTSETLQVRWYCVWPWSCPPNFRDPGVFFSVSYFHNCLPPIMICRLFERFHRQRNRSRHLPEQPHRGLCSY